MVEFKGVCPHCRVAVLFDEQIGECSSDPDRVKGNVYGVSTAVCLSCDRLIVWILWDYDEEVWEYVGGHQRERRVLFPDATKRKLAEEIPPSIAADFHEAVAVLGLSPKASAGLSRRILQTVLRDRFTEAKSTLFKEIEFFLTLPGIPPYLAEAVDSVRSYGNMAVHPEVDFAGKIVDVEPGEAEWMIETIEVLLDFAYVQPARLDANKKKLAAKLTSIGKKP